MSTLGQYVANAMNNAGAVPIPMSRVGLFDVLVASGTTRGVPYTSIPGHALYQGLLYSGTFKDMVYLTFNRTPSLTIELRGENGFMAPSASIRSSGEELVEAITAFASQLGSYYQLKRTV
ncbi:hypothetical protein H310_06158 [Aphanomyces invadans]|uniref:Uncharacterized protein n=1 Tax=Aphanomyces invadans TaxID=157072 RepID=A0A024U5F8_9STRA|nr:hypothetical protein H310_06158 [Aphanomyces invadans]ETW01484.1 hypothetical protein H310_06158 [Aphanomyces invadans]|eukprot:XP_008869332.1 hypothetical protein H310_06158 [Aphanomyces invadans]